MECNNIMLSTVELFALLIGLIIAPTPAWPHNRVIHVYTNGRDDQHCLNEQSQYCRTIEFIASEFRNETRNVTIILESQIYIRNKITFENFEHFAIQGYDEMANLKCNCKERGAGNGLSFVHINNLHLTHFKISLCCGVANAYNAAIFSQRCSNIVIENVLLTTNVHSTALALVNPQGEVYIRNCKFLRNGHKRLVNTTSFTGGLFVQFFQHTMATTIRIKTVNSQTTSHHLSVHLIPQ